MGRPGRFVTTQVEIEGRVETRVVEQPVHRPEPWADDSALEVVGRRVPRQDGPAKATGGATYTTDVALPGMLHAVLVRAPVASGRVVAVGREDALAMPGVVDLIEAGDLPRAMRVGGMALLSRDIRYAGQPVAAVCADSAARARAAARRIRMEVEPLPLVLTVADALAPGAPPVGRKGNVLGAEAAVSERGRVNEGLRQAAQVITREYHTPSVLHCAMEPHGAVAQWDGDRLTIHESTQGVFRVRDEVASAFGVPRADVRVISEHMGGGFGAKNNAGSHTLVAALFARRTGRPVACLLDRTGEQVDTGHRPSTRQVVTLGASADGRLVAIDAIVEIPLGVSGWEASPAAVYHELYACPNVRTRETFALVHMQPMQAFRAPGHAEGTFALERAMDVLAHALGLDPLDLRRRNFAAVDQPRTRPYSSNRLLECYEEGARRFGWAEREVRRNDGRGGPAIGTGGEGVAIFPAGGPPRTGHPSVRRGFGMASQVWGAGGGPPAYATVRLNSDGSVTVLAGTQDLGTGARTVLAQVAAESMGARLEDVTVILGDTDRAPYAPNSWGSMTTPSVGPAVHAAGDDARQRIVEAAAEILEVDPAGLTVAGSVVSSADGGTRLSLRDLARRLGNVMIMGHGSRGPNEPDLGLMSFGAQFAEVEVDPGTGVVRVTRIVAVHDAGRILNPLLAESQLHGGILQGLGYALFEERAIDTRTGRPLNPSLHDYKIPTFADTPVIEASCLDVPDRRANSIGARGLAEPPLIPTAPAIANAVADALGVEIGTIPLTPWRVLAAARTT